MKKEAPKVAAPVKTAPPAKPVEKKADLTKKPAAAAPAKAKK